MVGFILRLGSLPIRSSRTHVHVPHNEKGERELLVPQQSLKTLGFILIESAYLTCCQYVDRLALVPRGGGGQGQSPNNFLLHSVAGSNECWTSVSEQGGTLLPGILKTLCHRDGTRARVKRKGNQEIFITKKNYPKLEE